MEKYFMQLPHGSLFYRRAGSGPLMVLLHPSPRSSRMMEPLAGLLTGRFTVVCPDTPGYGFSDPLPQPPDAIGSYLPALEQLISSLTDAPVYLYGTATGAQLAIAFALAHPGRVAYLYLDNAAHFSDAECAEMLERYFPDLSPQPDGSHLQRTWQLACDNCLYFPWYMQDAAHRIAPVLPPAAVLHSMVQDYLAAGERYADAYIAAFKHERAVNVQRLSCATTVFKWLGSPLLRHIEALLAHRLPDNIAVAETPAPMEERYKKMTELMLVQ